VRLHWLAAGCNGAIVVADGKDLEEEYGVNGGFREVRVNAKIGAKGCPQGPVAVGSKGSGRYNAGTSHHFCSAEISMDCILLGSWQRFQPPTCG